MPSEGSGSPGGRQYPPAYERLVPIALGIIAVVIIVLLLIVLSVLVGIFPGG